MKATELSLPGLLLVESPVAEDERGRFFESWHQRKFRDIGIGDDFVQDNQSRSHRGVLRGLHAQLRVPQGKLVRVLEGEIFDVAVDIRPDSPTFGRSESVVLSAASLNQLWMPPGFAHGFYVLSDVAEVFYKCTALYDPADEIGIRWNDPVLGIDWPLASPVLSAKDADLPTLAEIEPLLRGAAKGSGDTSG